MKYLIFPAVGAAQLRSEAAFNTPPGGQTSALWGWREHPTDGRAALRVPATPAECGVGMTQTAYDALLTSQERAALIDELSPDWAEEMN